jgi:hypothetical protein
MTRYGPYLATNAHEVHVESKLKGIGALMTHDPPIDEDRQDDIVPSSRKFTVRAITQKFERQVADRQEIRRQSLACGSPIAERKKLLQQALSLQMEAVSQTEVDSQTGQKIDVVLEKKPLLRSKRGKTIAASRRKQASRVTDRMKVYEKGDVTENVMIHESDMVDDSGMVQEDVTMPSSLKKEATALPALATLVAPPASEIPSSKRQDDGAHTNFSESELSTLNYSIISDETPNARDEVEVLDRRQKPEIREILVPSQREEMDLPPFDSSLWLDNSFQRALEDIATSFDKDSGAPQGPNAPSRSAAVDKCKELTTNYSPMFQVMEASIPADIPGDLFPVSMFTSFDAEQASKESAASHDTIKNEGDLRDPGIRGQEDMMVPFDECMEENERNIEVLLSLEREYGDSSPSEALPNSSLFSTVEQVEERAKMNELRDGSVNDCIKVIEEPPKGFALTAKAGDQAQQERAFKQPNDSQVNPDIHELNAMFNGLEQAHDTNTSSHESSFGETGKDPSWSSEPNHDMSWFTVKDQFNYETEEEDHYEKDAKAGSITVEARDTEVHPDTTSTRYEIESKGDTPQIRGILKNKVDLLNPAAQAQASPVSSASWLSSATSMAASEVSQQLSPLQSSVPILPNRNRFSIGACINAHLLENQAQVGESLHPVSIWPQRLPGRDSANSSVNSQDIRINAVSPSSMDPQYSRSHHDHRQEFDAIAQAVSTMAKTASTVALIFVDAADKVVVSPLLSVFNCVDQSESFLCQGIPCAGAAGDPTVRSGKKSRKKKTRIRSRKFKG